MLYSLHIVIMPMCLRGYFDSQVGGWEEGGGSCDCSDTQNQITWGGGGMEGNCFQCLVSHDGCTGWRWVAGVASAVHA